MSRDARAAGAWLVARRRTVIVFCGLLAAVVVFVVWLGGAPATMRRAVLLPAHALGAGVRVWRFAYHAHDGSRRAAYIVLPAWYSRARDPQLPLVISPHGRGVGPRANMRLWGNLPARGSFALISPEGEGLYSWGDPRQISDLAAMPRLARIAMPWLRFEAHHVYAVGGSMGGQETLLLVAEHPHLLAGAAAFDSVANFAYQYHEFPLLRCDRRCLATWREPVGIALQTIARREIGGTPTSDPRGYAIRSPLDYARQIARSGVPLELWWSKLDLIVRNQQEQSGELFQRLRRLNPHASVEAFVGCWAHTAEMRSTTSLPFALAELGLLPARYERHWRGARSFARHCHSRARHAFDLG